MSRVKKAACVSGVSFAALLLLFAGWYVGIADETQKLKISGYLGDQDAVSKLYIDAFRRYDLKEAGYWGARIKRPEVKDMTDLEKKVYDLYDDINKPKK